MEGRASSIEPSSHHRAIEPSSASSGKEGGERGIAEGGVALAHHFSYHTALAHHREAASLRFTNLCNANPPKMNLPRFRIYFWILS